MSFFFKRKPHRVSAAAVQTDASAENYGHARVKVLTYVTLPNGKRKLRISRDALRRAHEHLQRAS